MICGKPALGLNGWDGGFPAYREFRAVWDPPRVFQDMVHFACLREWEHRDAMMAELIDLATDAVLEFDIEVGGQLHHITRAGLSYRRRLLAVGDMLVLERGARSQSPRPRPSPQPQPRAQAQAPLQLETRPGHHPSGADCLIVDLTGAWQFVNGRHWPSLIRGNAVIDQGGRGRYGLILSSAPSEATVAAWTLGDLLDHLDITACYPGLITAANGARLHIDNYQSANGRLEYSISHPLTIDPLVLDHFRNDTSVSAVDC